MKKVGTRRRAVRGARMPTWILDKKNQERWNARFLGILKKDYANTDASISAILNNQRLSTFCATKIRSYVDKDVTKWWYEQSKARGAKLKKKLDLAIRGLRAAIELRAMRGNQDTGPPLEMLADEFSIMLGRCKQAFTTKRHGRDRDHSFLLECHSFLQKELGQPVTYVTLANLVNAGHEAEGGPFEKTITEEQIRKNLVNFKRNNPLWRLYGSEN